MTSPRDERCVKVGLVERDRDRLKELSENGLIHDRYREQYAETAALLDSLLNQAHECDGGHPREGHTTATFDGKLWRCNTCDASFWPPLAEASRGDGPCSTCGMFDNPVWFTDNVFWNEIVRSDLSRWDGEPILCLYCFISLAERTHRPTGWRVLPEWPAVTREGAEA